MKDIDAHIQEIEALLRAKVAIYMGTNHRGIAYTLEVFDSDAGDDDWEAPLAASLEVPELGVEGYGLCDAATDSAEMQARFLYNQLLDEAWPNRGRKVRLSDAAMAYPAHLEDEQ